MKRTKFSSTAKSNRLPSSWRLFMDALRTYLDNWWGIWKIILVVYVPVGIISLITGPNDTVLSPFLGFAQIIMNIALIYAVAQLFENRPLPNTPTAYYDGSGVIVRYLLVLFLIVLMLLPAMFGLVIVALAFVPDALVAIGTPEKAILSFLALVFTLPTLYLVIRNGLGLVAVVREDLRPFASLRASRLVTRGYFWPVTARYLGFAFVGFLISLPFGLLTWLGYDFLKWQQASLMFFQLMTTLTTLPILTIFGYRLYLALEGRFEDRTGETRAEYRVDASTPVEDRVEAGA